jgi:excisionase family DNA binding protein
LTIEESIDAAVSRALDRHLGAIREALSRLEHAQPPRLLTVAQAAEAMGCHAKTVRRMVEAGQLVYKRVGRALRIDARSLHGAGGDDLVERRVARARR